MNFIETKISGAFIIEPEKLEDKRGYFLRSWCKKEFDAHGLESNFVQFNISLSKKAGTLRGMHYQIAPHQEAKLIRCTKGVLYEVIIDLRPKSNSYMQWFGVKLNAEMYKMLYIPPGVANGLLTLKNDTEVFYPVTQFYCAESERGIRWNDPNFNIEWPKTDVLIISEKDKNWPDYSM
jgi:dTDP-4-dehydrorhamnose 3,5-epimerase